MHFTLILLIFPSKHIPTTHIPVKTDMVKNIIANNLIFLNKLLLTLLSTVLSMLPKYLILFNILRLHNSKITVSHAELYNPSTWDF